MEEINSEWLAGVLDAKGLPVQGRREYPSLDLRLPSNNRKLLEAIQGHYGGSIGNKKSGTFQYSLGSNARLSHILRDIDPFLKFKRDKLALAQEFLRVARFQPPSNLERIQLWQSIRALSG